MTEELRNNAVDAVLATHWQEFLVWQSATQARQTLAIPSFVSSVFIPRRILELADNPNNVAAMVDVLAGQDEHVGNSFKVIVFERKETPLTDAAKFQLWNEQQQAEKKKIRILPQNQAEAPEGIDYMHIRYKDLINNGTLTLNDKAYFEYIGFKKYGEEFGHVAHTGNYTDREELRGQGIGRSFYDRLEMVLKQLQFRYLVGNIVSLHPGFFKKDRTKYEDLSPDIRADLPGESVLRAGLPGFDIMVKVL